jgi:hypothetical protein
MSPDGQPLRMADERIDVAITLPRDEALVLFEWLSHELETGRLDQLLTDGADWVAVHQLLGQLESALAEPFDPDYKKLRDLARNRLRLRAPSA